MKCYLLHHTSMKKMQGALLMVNEELKWFCVKSLDFFPLAMEISKDSEKETGWKRQ